MAETKIGILQQRRIEFQKCRLDAPALQGFKGAHQRSLDFIAERNRHHACRLGTGGDGESEQAGQKRGPEKWIDAQRAVHFAPVRSVRISHLSPDLTNFSVFVLLLFTASDR